MTHSTARESAEHGKQTGHPKSAAAPASPVLAAAGLGFDGIGNRSLLNLLRSGRLQRKACTGPPVAVPRPLVQRKCACGSPAPAQQDGQCEECRKAQGPSLQAKLQINEPGDSFEQEADRIAEQVTAAPASISSAPVSIQRVAGSVGGSPNSDTDGVAHLLSGQGQPLEPSLRQEMEQSFGHDFAKVRVHTDAEAGQSARDLDAQAYTVGQSIVFGAGRFAPGTPAGRRLIAHELTHVVQQSGPGKPSQASMVQRACLPEAECATPKGQPRAGTATEFGEQMEQQSAPKQAQKRQQTAAVAQAGGHGRRASEVEKLFQQHLPNLRPMIHAVVVDDTLPADAGAARTDCLEWAKNALPKDADQTPFTGATHSCIVIPKQLESQAAIYNQNQQAKPDPRFSRSEWLQWFVTRVLTHEVTHERLLQSNIAFPAKQDCTQQKLAKEVSELAAVISEFPIVSNLSADLGKAWAKALLTDPRQNPGIGESIFGAIRDIRCSCECDDADSLIRAAFEIASSTWSDEDKLAFHAYMKRGEGKSHGVYWPYESNRVGRVGPNELSLTGGIAFSGDSKLAVAMLTYRRVIWDLAHGRLRLTTGAQYNLASLKDEDPAGEKGALLLGLRYLQTPVSTEQVFGGLTGRVETGLGLGEFSLKPAGGGSEQKTDWILGVGGGIQFFIPRLADMKPATLEAALRYAHPIGGGAKDILSTNLSLSFPF